MHLSEATLLQGGKYRIIRVLGQGGFGITYLAHNVSLGKNVAIKEFFPKEFCERANTKSVSLGTFNNVTTVNKLRERFLKEARNIGRLDHPGIVRIIDVFEQNNTAYYVMDYVEGQSLSQMVKQFGPMPEYLAVNYIVNVGHALDYIHKQKMTHFDVKPSNIMISARRNTPVLIDFGLSKQFDSEGHATSSVMQAVSHGFSPLELYNTQTLLTFSPQTDVYSVGATLYFLLTATAPPAASDLIEEGIPFPQTISPHIKEIIKRAMSVSRKNRYQSVADLCNALLQTGNTLQTAGTTSIFNQPQPHPHPQPRPLPKPKSVSEPPVAVAPRVMPPASSIETIEEGTSDSLGKYTVPKEEQTYDGNISQEENSEQENQNETYPDSGYHPPSQEWMQDYDWEEQDEDEEENAVNKTLYAIIGFLVVISLIGLLIFVLNRAPKYMDEKFQKPAKIEYIEPTVDSTDLYYSN